MTGLDIELGTPCLVCGASILRGIGHDAGCMVLRHDHELCGRGDLPHTYIACACICHAMEPEIRVSA